MIGGRSEESRPALVASPKNKGVLFLQSKLHTRPLVLTKVVTAPFTAGASWRNPSIRAGCAHISDLAEIIYYLEIGKSHRRKLSGFPLDTSVRRIVRISSGQRSM
jgi:hypothetical protein